MEIKSKEIKIVPVGDILPHPKNPNKHPKEQIDRLCEIIRYQGFRQPLVVSNQSKFLIVGHGRLEAAKKLGFKELPVIYEDFLNDDMEYAHMTADNAVALWADLDLDSIKYEIPNFAADFNIDLLGIKDFEIPKAIEPGCDEDEVPEEVEAVAKLGDIYKLGNHRLMCGDSTDKATVEKLMDGQKADMVFTDPPYGVDYQGGVLTKRKKLNNDHKQTNIYRDILPILYAYTKTEAPFYIWHAAGYADMASHIWDSGLDIRSQIIWNKNLAQFGALSAQYKQKHEPCFYCFKKGNAPNWYGPTNEVTVWDVKRESKNEFHPTQKPIELVERANANSSKSGDIVLDLFGGSGSTLIACEKTNRKCFMMELDPHYVDVIIARWEKFTGKKAEKIN